MYFHDTWLTRLNRRNGALTYRKGLFHFFMCGKWDKFMQTTHLDLQINDCLKMRQFLAQGGVHPGREGPQSKLFILMVSSCSWGHCHHLDACFWGCPHKWMWSGPAAWQSGFLCPQLRVTSKTSAFTAPRPFWDNLSAFFLALLTCKHSNII